MTDPGSRGGFDPLAPALGIALFIVVAGWISATVIETAPGQGCRLACACREASP